jgi:hypothetical protein
MSNSNYKKMCWDCLFCNKSFSSQSSLCNHKKKFHLNIKSEKNTETINKNTETINKNTETINKNTETTDNIKKSKKTLICDFCDRVFNYASSKAYHKKVCKVKKCKEEEEKQQKEEIKNITINNQTINNINNNINNQTIINQTINITNNIIYNFDSKEEKIFIKDIIDENDKNNLYSKDIQDKLLEFVKLVYTKYKCLQNVLLTNKSPYNKDIHIFQDNELILKDKDETLDKLVYNCMDCMKKIDMELNMKRNVDNTKTDKIYNILFSNFKKDKEKFNKKKYLTQLNKNKNRISQLLYSKKNLIKSHIKSYINNTGKIKNENVKLIENIKNENVKLIDEKKEIIIDDYENEYNNTIDIINFDKSKRNNFIKLIVETIDEILYFDIFNQHFETWIIQIGKFIYRGKHNKFKNVFIKDGKGYSLMGNKFIEDKIEYLLEEIIIIIFEVIELLNEKYNFRNLNKKLIENNFKKMTDLYDEEEYVRFYYDVDGNKYKTFNFFVKTKIQEIIQK